MLRSMTGYGSAAAETGEARYFVELRSVNNRYLKVALRLPEGLSALEPQIESRLRERLGRGTVTVTVRMKLPDAAAAQRVNIPALSSYLDQLRLLESEANPMLRVDLASLMLLPGVCEPPAPDELAEQTGPRVMELLDEAVDALLEMRHREGEAVGQDLRDHCETILARLDEVAERAPTVVQDYHQRLVARVEELTRAASLRLDEETLAREVALFAERSDVAEELSRLRGHVEQFTQALDSPEPAGRKLDFISQEMLREANTIASKANDAQMVRAVVEIKTAIDRIKEQVQNVE